MGLPPPLQFYLIGRKILEIQDGTRATIYRNLDKLPEDQIRVVFKSFLSTKDLFRPNLLK